MNLLFQISYGLYILSAKEGDKDNACVINTLIQQTSSPERLSITVNNANYTCDMIKKSGVCAVTVLATYVNFDTIKNFGMQSGRTVNKFYGQYYDVTPSGIKIPLFGALGYFELKVAETHDLGTHTLFICDIAYKENIAEGEPLTYAYYQNNIKPKPAPKSDTGESWVCSVCGYVHSGPLPADFVCPVCKHGAADFTKQ